MEKIKFNIDDYKKEVQESNKECIDTILCTKRLSQDDKFEYIENLNKLYDFCKLERPENIVFVSSPILLAFSSGAARYYWNEIMVKDSATRSATDSATRSATRSATKNATISATDSASRSATDSATRSATDSATYSATEISTGIIVPENYVKCILDFFKSMNISVDENLLHTYIKGFNSIYQGGNNWASWDYYLNLYRKIGKPIPGHDYTGFDLWNKLNVAGARVLERDFAMISEKPTSIVMKNDLAHNLQGPAVEFMDGVKYYMAYGNFIPSWIVTTPIKDITKEKILNEKNVDHRRYLIERIGIEKYIDILGGANVLDVYESKIGGRYELLQIDINGEKCNYLKMINQTEFVYHIEGVTNECETVKDAIMFRNGMKSFAEPKYLS